MKNQVTSIEQSKRLIEVIIPPYPGAYYYTCFETEAYNHEDDPDYLKRRIPFWGWISCIPNRKVKHKI